MVKTKKRIKKLFKKRRKDVEGLTDGASKHLDKHVFKKISKDNGHTSWRFIISWLLLFVVLIGGVGIQARALGRYYTGSTPVGGGEFVEGIVGDFGNANPLFATSAVDTAVSRLLFNGLLKYDDSGELVPDIASSWTVDERGTTYTVVLKNNVRWHDGTRVVSEDVVYTIEALQNPDTRSPFNLSWRGVKVQSVDENTVVFTLPNPLSSFIYSLTQPIVPSRILGNIPYGQLRSSDFNNKNPIGTGPFVWSGVINNTSQGDDLTQTIRLSANENYFLGAPKLSRYTIDTFDTQAEVKSALSGGRINAATLESISELSSTDRKQLNQFNIPYMSAVYIFFNNSRAPLSDKNVRNGLIRGIDTDNLRAQLDYPVTSVDSPFLRSHSTYDPTRVQAATSYSDADALLDTAGWVKVPNSFIRQKDQKPLEFTLLSEDTPDFARIADVLQKQMTERGVKLNVDLKEGKEFQRALLNHEYDALLYGISLGADPDVYAFWHSSQAVPERFNLSEYKSPVADEALESGRTRRDVDLRSAKYRPFLDVWSADAPAVGLYQPRQLFVTNGPLYNFEVSVLVTQSDRYTRVHEWMINTEQTTLIVKK